MPVEFAPDLTVSFQEQTDILFWMDTFYFDIFVFTCDVGVVLLAPPAGVEVC